MLLDASMFLAVMFNDIEININQKIQKTCRMSPEDMSYADHELQHIQKFFSTSLRPEFKRKRNSMQTDANHFIYLRYNDSEAFQWRSLRLATCFFPSLNDDMVGTIYVG